VNKQQYRCTNINFPAKGRAGQVPSSQGNHRLQKGSLQENVVFLTQKSHRTFWLIQNVCEINFVNFIHYNVQYVIFIVTYIKLK
jgi:hypothetical protein